MTVQRRCAMALLLATLVAQAAGPQTVILVRHAEKAGASGDVPLTSEGKARAQALARILRDARIGAVFSSEFVRTRDTAAPVAEAAQIRPQTVPAGDLETLVRRIRAAGAATLVVHHSNTIPRIVELLGAGPIPPIGEDEYDRLIIVTLPAEGQPGVVTLRYAP